MMVLVPLQLSRESPLSTYSGGSVETAGFLVTTCLQSATTLALFLAIDHERQYRSSGKEWVRRISSEFFKREQVELRLYRIIEWEKGVWKNVGMYVRLYSSFQYG